MKKCCLLAIIVFSLIKTGKGAVSVVMNGSFENDGWTSSQDITVLPPLGWPDVHIPRDSFGNYSKFGAFVGKPWSEQGDHCLTLFSKSAGKYQAGEYAAVSQKVYLDDVSTLSFAVHLTTEYPVYVTWSNHEFSAFVAIDNVMVWNSHNLDITENETYLVDVNNLDIQDGNEHSLTLAMISNNTITLPYYISYIARFDFLRFDTHCGGFGYLAGDIDRDCRVDFDDYGLIADKWLADANQLPGYAMPDEGPVDAYALSIIAADWLACTDSADANCIEAPLCYDDVDRDGAVGVTDIQLLSGEWLMQEPNSMKCDINCDRVVDSADFASMANSWCTRNWFYGL